MLNLYYFVLPMWHGLRIPRCAPRAQQPHDAGVAHVPGVVGGGAAAARERSQYACIGTLIRRLLLVYCSAATANWLALGRWHQGVVQIVYGGAYTSDSQLLWIVGLVPLGYAVITLLENALRSLERSDEVFKAYVVSLAATCLIGLPLTFVWGVGGAAAGLVIASVCLLTSLARSLRTRGRPLNWSA